MGPALVSDAYGWFALLATVVAMLAVAGAILLFERRRAREIEHDLREPPRDRAE
jgi:hypothetical protein